MKDYNIIKNKLGYLEIDPKPTESELEKHYKDKYYQQGSGCYSQEYSKDELSFFENQAKVCEATINEHVNDKTLLDIGCGEGFFSKFFFEKKWDVTCVDFSNVGIKNHNPQLLNQFQQNNIFSFLSAAVKNNLKYGLINLDNVLEHVLDPVTLLQAIMQIMTKNSIVRIEVPNDFSAFQKLLTHLECTT